MHQSSETVGKIAAALAQAQRQLENPEKTLMATIASPFPREGTISFRYASLASGLEIIRKALGEHEIAAIQRTEIDKELGLIRLTTVLAHSSGEWIESDWPVCAMTEIGAPHRLGAALTYARRYALFALVGITGEDDLDAPDLPINLDPAKPASSGGRIVQQNKLLLPSESKESREKLISELEGIVEIDDLTLWALRRLPLKNKLQDHDAAAVDVAYRAKLDKSQGISEPTHTSTSHLSSEATSPTPPLADRGQQDALQLPKTPRRRNKAHLAYVASQPCLVCQQKPCDAHHLKFAQPRAMGRKVSDEFTVPLCREHHNDLHSQSNEVSWWANVGIAPLPIASKLWAETIRDKAAA